MHRVKGFLMVIIGASLWGLSGTVAQYLFHHYHVSMEWLVTTRLLISGVLLILFSLMRGSKKVWLIWTDKKSVFQILLFGLLGMLGVQYTYFAAIDAGNAAVATLLQYLAPVFIAVYFIGKLKALPKIKECIAIVLAIVGTFLLLTNGSINTLAVSGEAVFWGVLSGIALAFYTLYPNGLLKKWGSLPVVGWGMLIGGIGMSFKNPPWDTHSLQFSTANLLLIGFVIFFGTLIAFLLYVESLNYISAKETSLIACVEPLTAVVSSVLALHIKYGLFQCIGTLCIVTMLVLLSLKKRKPRELKKPMLRKTV